MSSGPLINPREDPRIRDVDPGDFHAEMKKRIVRDGKPPKVQVLIQVRGNVVPVEKYRRQLARAITHMKKRDVPRDERGPLLERAMQETGTREWETVEVFWEGRYHPEQVEFPSVAKLEQIEEKLGAAEAKAVVRAST